MKVPGSLRPTRLSIAAATTFLTAVSVFAGSACDGLIGLDPPILMREDAASPDAGPSDAGPKPAADAQEAAPVDAIACTSTACPSGCADLTSDGQNCGACGHSCLGGTCGGGRCLPEVLAVGNPLTLAVDTTNIYWSDGVYGTITSCPLAGCPDGGGQTLFIGVGGYSPFIGGLAARGGRVFFIEGSNASAYDTATLYSCPSTGCGNASSSLVVEATGTGMAVVTDSNHVYWTSSQGVLDCPVAGCGGGMPTTLVSGDLAPNPWSLAVGGGFVYFSNFGAGAGVGSCGLSSGGCSCPPNTGGCPLGSMANIPNVLPSALAVGASSVYWTLASNNEVVAAPFAPPDAGVPSDGVFATADAPGDLAVDSTNVYFTAQQAGGTIYECAIGGCGLSPTVVASGLGGLGAITVDAKRIYAVVGAQNNETLMPNGNAIIWIAK